MEFVHAAKAHGLPKIVSIQNSYSLIVRCHFEGETITSIHSFHSLNSLINGLISEIISELLRISFFLIQIERPFWLWTSLCFITVDLVEVCHPNNCNVGLLAYSPLAGGVLTGKYLDANANISNRSRLNLFPGYMARYNASLAKVRVSTTSNLSVPLTVCTSECLYPLF